MYAGISVIQRHSRNYLKYLKLKVIALRKENKKKQANLKVSPEKLKAVVKIQKWYKHIMGRYHMMTLVTAIRRKMQQVRKEEQEKSANSRATSPTTTENNGTTAGPTGGPAETFRTTQTKSKDEKILLDLHENEKKEHHRTKLKLNNHVEKIKHLEHKLNHTKQQLERAHSIISENSNNTPQSTPYNTPIRKVDQDKEDKKDKKEEKEKDKKEEKDTKEKKEKEEKSSNNKNEENDDNEFSVGKSAFTWAPLSTSTIIPPTESNEQQKEQEEHVQDDALIQTPSSLKTTVTTTSPSMTSSIPETSISNKETSLWKPDEYRTECKKCQSSFTFFTRRTHCKRCGDLFCSNCTTEERMLPAYLTKEGPVNNPDRNNIKVCERCANEFDQTGESVSTPTKRKESQEEIKAKAKAKRDRRKSKHKKRSK